MRHLRTLMVGLLSRELASIASQIYSKFLCLTGSLRISTEQVRVHRVYGLWTHPPRSWKGLEQAVTIPEGSLFLRVQGWFHEGPPLAPW